MQKTISAPIDLERLASLLGDDDEPKMFEYLGLFRGIFPDLINEIETAITNRDARALHHAAHKAKGAASSAAATVAMWILRDLEADAKHETWDDFQQRLSILESEYSRIEAFCVDHSH